MSIRAFLVFLVFVISVVAFSAPALADILELSCTADSFIAPDDGSVHPYALDIHVSVDLVRQTVKESTGADNGERPYAASISDTFIKWDEPFAKIEGWSYKYSIDRSTGKLSYDQYYRGDLHATVRGPCVRATQKF